MPTHQAHQHPKGRTPPADGNVALARQQSLRKQDRPPMAIPGIALTATAMQRDRAHGRSVGRDAGIAASLSRQAWHAAIDARLLARRPR
jgi:hypothetical protein